MKRTENSLDSKQVLSVIERYNTALELLDSYDHQRMERPKRNARKEEVWRIFVKSVFFYDLKLTSEKSKCCTYYW